MKAWPALVFLAISPAACSARAVTVPSTAVPCLEDLPAVLSAQLASPLSGSTGVSAAGGTIIYLASEPVGDLVLVAGPVGGSTPAASPPAGIGLIATELLSPLPSPIATAPPPANPSAPSAGPLEAYFAVAYPVLRPDTTYTLDRVFATTPCGRVDVPSGSFTTG